MPTVSRLLAASGFACALAAPALAQNAPPIKPGLWEVHMQHEGAGMPRQMPDMSEHLKNMPPEQRKQMEAMMKERGVDMSGGPGKMRICLDKASLDQGRWQGGEQGGCKTDVLSRSATSWKWKSVCTEPQAVSEGEASFATAESYTVRSTTTMTRRGEERTIKTTLNSKWLGADCGDVKPVQAPRKK